MHNLDILIIPYRDLYFWSNYGSAVRDLQFLEIILELKKFDNVIVLNRPVSIYERLTNKKLKEINYPGINIIDKTSFDLFGPLKRRAWTANCYNSILLKTLESYKKSNNKRLIVLDFSPIANLPINKDANNIFYWHDMIDNFAKHNRFTRNEKELVIRKYKNVALNYDYLSSVSSEAANEIITRSNINHMTVPNGVFNTKFQDDKGTSDHKQKYDLGFIGFVTDKFDLNIIDELSKKYSIVIYGEIYDNSIRDKLIKIGVTLKGKFRYNNSTEIMKTFKVGLIPYLEEKSHDGSPLKLYEYLKHNLPCITTIDYEFKCDYIFNIKKSASRYHEINNLILKSGNPAISATLPKNVYLHHNVEKLISNITDRFNKKINNDY